MSWASSIYITHTIITCVATAAAVAAAKSNRNQNFFCCVVTHRSKHLMACVMTGFVAFHFHFTIILFFPVPQPSAPRQNVQTLPRVPHIHIGAVFGNSSNTLINVKYWLRNSCVSHHNRHHLVQTRSRKRTCVCVWERLKCKNVLKLNCIRFCYSSQFETIEFHPQVRELAVTIARCRSSWRRRGES